LEARCCTILWRLKPVVTYSIPVEGNLNPKTIRIGRHLRIGSAGGNQTKNSVLRIGFSGFAGC
jgi:hypothetical protein